MSNLYVPLNYSNLQEFVSDEEKVVYSTICKVIVKSEIIPKAWFTHLLITTKGLYFGELIKHNSLKVLYFDWGGD